MPGRQLSQSEKRLLRIWESASSGLRRPYLESIAVGGGLRGIDELFVPFRYPISALCGKNGVGKSTLLALAALAHHGAKDWSVPSWLYQPRLRSGNRSYYTFGDFFLRSTGDQSFDGVSITWTYRAQDAPDPVTFRKTASRWGRYTRRPEREVAFSPLSRLVMAHEVSGVRSAFVNRTLDADTSLLSDAATRQLSYVMDREYSSAEIQEVGRHKLQRARSDAVFSGFNMGGGESCIINLLHTLHELPRGSLLVIEEIEAGLHPQAQIRLASVLVNLCLCRQTQIICTTHSEAFLDALPRRARILVTRRGAVHQAIESPSTRFAIHEMTGEPQPELIVYCEDLAARVLIEEALPHSIKVRVRVCDVGDSLAVIRQGVSHQRAGLAMRAICVLDGDCSESEIETQIDNETRNVDVVRPDYSCLPGELPPEKWVMEQLRFPDYRVRFSEQFNCSITDAVGMIESALTELDHHNLGYRLKNLTGRESDDCLRLTMRSVAPVHPQLDELRMKIRSILE